MINILMDQKRGLNRFNKLPDDGDPWAPNNLLKLGAKEKHQLTPMGKATDKRLRPQPTKLNSFNDFKVVFFRAMAHYIDTGTEKHVSSFHTYSPINN